MLAVWKLIFLSLCYSASAVKPKVDPEYLNMLRESGRHEEFAKLLGLEDVSLVHPMEGRTEEDFTFTTVSPLGDVLLTPEQEEQARQGINFQRFPRSRWDNHVIPYEIGKGEFSKSQRRRIESGFSQLNKVMKNVEIVPRTDEQDYVYVMSGRGCWSYLGKTGGQQAMSLQSNGCLSRGTIMHEMMHAMGLTHEQSRSDRDEYVDVLFDNIPQEWHSQYEKVSSSSFNNLGPYDPYSVMHYGMRAPGTGKPAFKFHDRSVDTSKVGQRSTPTDIDIQKGDALYS